MVKCIKLSNSTKLKIIKWVEKILNYKYPPIRPYIITKRNIVQVQSTALLKRIDNSSLSEFGQIYMTKRSLENNLLKELIDKDLIQYEETEDAYHRSITIKLFVVEPFKNY